MNKKILIIGSRGFIGKQVVSAFKSEKNVQIFEGYKHNIDLSNIQSFKKAFNKIKPDVIINLAAFSHLDKSDFQNIFKLNCFSVIDLVDFLISNNFDGRFINTSSALIYGTQTKGVIKEDSPLRPEHTYAVAKAAIDNLFGIIQKDLQATSVRPFNCIGIGHREDYVVPKIIKHFHQKKQIIELGDIHSKRDFVDVRDVGRMYLYCSKIKTVIPSINLCSGKAISIKSIVQKLEKISDHQIKIEINSKYIRDVDSKNMRGDNSIITSLGFEYNFSINDTLKWIYNNK